MAQTRQLVHRPRVIIYFPPVVLSPCSLSLHPPHSVTLVCFPLPLLILFPTFYPLIQHFFILSIPSSHSLFFFCIPTFILISNFLLPHSPLSILLFPTLHPLITYSILLFIILDPLIPHSILLFPTLHPLIPNFPFSDSYFSTSIFPILPFRIFPSSHSTSFHPPIPHFPSYPSFFPYFPFTMSGPLDGVQTRLGTHFSRATLQHLN